MHFLQIKPNSDKNIDSILNESILKILNSNQLMITQDSIADMSELIEDYCLEISKDDPILYINSFFANINKIENINEDHQFYDILAINKSDDKYNLLLINNHLNNNYVLNQLSNEERTSNFNLTASSLSQYYNNSNAIFGDVFLISINSSYYNLLEKITSVKNDADDKNISEELIESSISKIYTKLNSYNTIYYNYRLIDLFKTMADIYYINIYVQPLNKTMLYSRGILNNYIQNNKPKIITDQLIQITYNDLILYIKITDILPNSHNHIVIMIKNESDNYYLCNITNNDIELLLKNI